MNETKDDVFQTRPPDGVKTEPLNFTVFRPSTDAATALIQATFTKFAESTVVQTTTVTLTTAVFPEQPSNTTFSSAHNKTFNGFRPLSNDDTAAHLLTVAYITVFIFAILGNTLVIHTVRARRTLSNGFNWLLVNMALADIMDAAFAIPYSVYSLYYNTDWFQGVFASILCKMLNYGMSVAIGASVLTMAIISANRYRAIVQALKSPMSVRATFKCIAAVWVICVVSYSIDLYRFDAIPSWEPEKFVCAIRNEQWHHVMEAYDFIVKIVINYALPLAVMSVVYSIIIYTLRKRQPVGEYISRAQRRHRLQARRVVKMVVTILTVFAVCWLPAHVIHLLFLFNREAAMKIPLWAVHFAFWMAHANSAFNPFIVLVFGKQLREASKKSLHNLVYRKSKRSDHFLLKSTEAETVM